MGWLSKKWKQIKRGAKKVAREIKRVVNQAVDGVKNLVKGAVDFVGNLTGSPTMPDPGVQTIQYQEGTTINVRGGDNTIPLIYGNSQDWTRVGSTMSHMSSDGDKNKYLYLTYVICHGEIEGLQISDAQAPFPERKINFLGGLFATDREMPQYTVEGKTWNKIRAFKGDGSVSTPSWHPDKAEYRHMAHVKIRLEWPVDLDVDKKAPYTGLPDLKFEIRRPPGTQLSGGANGGSVNILYDYMLSPYYGMGLTVADIDLDSFNAYSNNSAKWGEGRATALSAGGAVYGAYTPTARIDTAQPVVANLKALLFSMGCTLIWKNNKFYLKANPNLLNLHSDASTTNFGITTHTIDESDVIGGIHYEAPSEDSKYSKVILESYDDQQTTSIAAPDGGANSIFGNVMTWLTGSEDNNATSEYTQTVIGKLNIQLPRTIYSESHSGSTIQLATTAKHANIEPYDIIDLTYPKANISRAKYVVRECEFTGAETLVITAVRYLHDNDAEGYTTTQLYTKTLEHETLTQLGGSAMTRLALAAPVGAGLENNTNFDKFLPSRQSMIQVSAIQVDTSPEHHTRFGEVIINRAVVSWIDVGNSMMKTVVETREVGTGGWEFKASISGKSFGSGYSAFVYLKPETEYYVRVTPQNSEGFGASRTVKFTTSANGYAFEANINGGFGITDENGGLYNDRATRRVLGGIGGIMELYPGSIYSLRDYVRSFNPSSSSYIDNSYAPLGNDNWNSFTDGSGTTYGAYLNNVLKQNDTIPDKLYGEYSQWGDYDFTTQEAYSNTKRPMDAVNCGQLSTKYTDTEYPVANEANFDARVGQWGGTAHAEYQALIDAALEPGGSWTNVRASSTASGVAFLSWTAAVNGTLAVLSTISDVVFYGKELNGDDSDYWWEGKVYVTPDNETANMTTGTLSTVNLLEPPSVFVYMNASAAATATGADANHPAADTWTGMSRANMSGVQGIDTDDNLLATGSLGPEFTLFQSGTPHLAWPTLQGPYTRPIFFFKFDDDARGTWGIRKYEFKLSNKLYHHTFKAVDTSTLSGTSAARTMTWTSPRFGRIKNIIITPHRSETTPIIGRLTTDPTDNTQSITFKVVNSTSNADVNAVVDIQVSGYPEVKHVASTSPLGNTIYTEYKNNFEGTL